MKDLHSQNSDASTELQIEGPDNQALAQDHFLRLPAELIEKIILPELEKKDRENFAKTCKRNLSIFTNFFANSIVPQLILSVAHGGLDKAENILLKTKLRKQRMNQQLDMALKCASVMDYSHRVFPEFRINPDPKVISPNASALKLARWTRDWYIVEILLMHLPGELKAQAIKQIQDVKLYGIDYEYELLLDGEVTPEMVDEQGASVLDGRTPVILRGCEVIMLSLPENENIDQDILREISAKHDEQPILIKRGDKIYLYGFAESKSTESEREWRLSEMQHSGFSKLDFPKECRNPERKYLALRKASETLTETMSREIKEIQGEISYPYSFILMSIPEDQNEKIALEKRTIAKRQFEKELTQIATENPNQPILVRQGESIFLYEFKNNTWARAQLNDPGFKDLAFPKEGYCSLKLPPRKTHETLTQEMRQEMSLAHNFVDYRVQWLGFKKTDHGAKTLVQVQVLGERGFDYHPLKEALKDFIELDSLWRYADYLGDGDPLNAAVEYQFNRVLGLAQCYATAFLGQQYCHPKRSFENVKFDEAEFRGQDRRLEFHDSTSFQKVFWFLRDSGLGSHLGITRMKSRGGAGGYAYRRAPPSNLPDRWLGVSIDLRAIETLCEVSYKRLASVEQKFLVDALAPSNSHG